MIVDMAVLDGIYDPKIKSCLQLFHEHWCISYSLIGRYTSVFQRRGRAVARTAPEISM